MSYATKVMESKHQLDVIYTDFQKAFDRAKHSILLYKLKKLGVHSELLFERTYALHLRFLMRRLAVLKVAI